MAKKNKKKTQARKKVAKEESAVTWDDIAAMSDSDDEGDLGNTLELNSKAKTLKDSIAQNIGGMLALLKKTSENEDEEDFEEDVLDGSSSEENEDDSEGEDVEEEDQDELSNQEDDDVDEDNKEKSEKSFIEKIKNKTIADEDGDGDSDSDSESEDSDDENDEGKLKSEKYMKLENSNSMNSKALSVVATEMDSKHSKMPWAETFVIIPPTPLPFGENGDPESNPLDIHDDLKREVAFYNTALEAVNLARPKLKESNIPFTRPEDFFAEMVKTDDHMAGVKDRLIFENKKIEAVAQRKSNKEQKLRAKESQANRLAEKSKRKRDHFQELEEWASSAAKNRGGALRDDVDDHFLNNRYNGTGPSKKRQNADKKFGFGGKAGRFKQNNRKSMNDMSGFNSRGNFAGGMKKSNKDGGGSGANRAGKRARDAKRARR